MAGGHRPKIHSHKELQDTAVDPTSRLRIATRIHFALLRHYGEDVTVDTLLQGGIDAREALWVCEASGHDDLVALARQFDATAAARPVVAAPRGAVPQDMAWSQDTSGFGHIGPSQLGELGASPARPSRWLAPSTWLRGSSPR
jgi:hypothetical protein